MTAPLFCLGGRDLEMLEIARLVRGTLGPDAVIDKGLPWHAAKASAYADEIVAALDAGRRPVLVELQPDLPAPLVGRCTTVDHHGPHAGDRPTSLEQVFTLLELPRTDWNRRLALIAANDRGWIPELRAMGAQAPEIAAIRAEDRAAQGTGSAEEMAAEAAIGAAETVLDGSLVLVRLAHDRTATVFDRLALAAGAADPPDTLVQGPTELNFSGVGRRVLALVRAYPNGWSGGALPERGFWGHARPLPPLDAVVGVIAGA